VLDSNPCIFEHSSEAGLPDGIFTFQSKTYNLGILWGTLEWNVGIRYCHLEYFTAIWYMSLWAIWYIFGHFGLFHLFGKLYQDKSGNPAQERKPVHPIIRCKMQASQNDTLNARGRVTRDVFEKVAQNVAQAFEKNKHKTGKLGKRHPNFEPVL
jgi:hypothetical protein